MQPRRSRLSPLQSKRLFSEPPLPLKSCDTLVINEAGLGTPPRQCSAGWVGLPFPLSDVCAGRLRKCYVLVHPPTAVNSRKQPLALVRIGLQDDLKVPPCFWVGSLPPGTSVLSLIGRHPELCASCGETHPGLAFWAQRLLWVLALKFGRRSGAGANEGPSIM